MPVDKFRYHEPALSSPAVSGRGITPSDVVEIPFITRGLYVGTSGNVVVEFEDGEIVTFANVAAGSVLPVRAVRVRSATTAGSIVALQ